jgi:hypothetical protein
MNKVSLYTLSTCPWCRKATQFFTEPNIRPTTSNTILLTSRPRESSGMLVGTGLWEICSTVQPLNLGRGCSVDKKAQHLVPQ